MNALEQEHYTILGSAPFQLGEFTLASFKAREGAGRIVLLRQITRDAHEAGALLAASQAAASLPTDPHILRHYGLVAVSEDPTGESGLQPGVYASSEWVTGITLSERIRRVAPFSVSVALNTAFEVARALARAESAGIEHGSLTAEEVLVTSDGSVKVADFVLGRAAHPAVAASFAENTLEAFAALLYEMLTGKMATSAARPLAPQRVERGVPNALDGITQKASLGAASAGGYTSAAELLADLQAAREDLRQNRSLDWTPLRQPTPRFIDAQPPQAEPQEAFPPPARTSPRFKPMSASADPKRSEQIDPSPHMPNNFNATEEPSLSRQIPAARIDNPAAARRNRAGSADDEDNYEPARSRGSSVLRGIGIILGSMFIIAAVFGCVYLALLVSNVPSDTNVPNIIGKQFADAKAQVTQQHLKLVELGHSNSDTWPEGAIYQQSPVYGRMIKSGKAVDVWVSDGPRLIDVPDLSQTTLDKAQAVLQDAGLPLGSVEYVYDNIVPKGIVTLQQPAAASKVARDQAINLTVSKGPSPPQAPTNLSATCTIEGQIDLSWDQVPVATAYDIYRDGKKIQTGLPETQYSDVGLDATTTHIYTVTAVNANGESPASLPASSVAQPAALTTPPDASQPGDETQTNQTDPSADQNATPQPLATPAQGGPKQRQFEIKFRVPRGSSYTRNVQIQVQDATGTNYAYNQDVSRGTIVDEQVQGFGNRVILRIFIDGKLVKQETK